MDLIRLSITRPVAVISAVLMIVMFGVVGLTTIPIQLAPDVQQPVIQVETNWPGAAPLEIEREIVNRQEDVLKGLEGVEKITASAKPGTAEVTLEFAPGQDMDKALLLVANRLDRVGGYPAEVDEPTLNTSGTDDNPITWMVLRRTEGNTTPIYQFGDFAEDVIQDRIERVSGVSRMNVFGGSERELQVTIDPARMASYGLTVPEVVNALRAANIALTAGEVEEGKRSYVVRVDGELQLPEQVSKVLVRSSSDDGSGRVGRVTVGDIADVAFGYKDPFAQIRRLGEPVIAMNAIRETGANVIETMQGVREAVAELNAGPLAARGLEIVQVYDETVYINSAIDLVLQNIYVGGALAAAILSIFLRSIGATLVVSLAIPVSVIGAFVGMAALGRSLNVVSLAGIAFAVGMVVDAAIVVLENIFRLRQLGYSRASAAYIGAKQVWGAIMVSALTTVMVFIPILMLDLEVGQLFRDIAVAISVAVMLSLIVAITVVPALARRLLGASSRKGESSLRIPVLDPAAGAFARGIAALAGRVGRNRTLAFGMVASVVAGASVLTVFLLPKLEYLPEGNRNLVFGVILPPPGYNLETTTDIATTIEQAVKPHWVTEEPPADPVIEHFFFVALRDGRTFLGAAALDPQRAAALIPVLRGPIFREPGTFGFVTQPSLFGRSVGGGRSVNLDISGDDLETILGVAQQAAGRVMGTLPPAEGNQFRPIPGLELGAPEVRVYPDPLRLEDNGVSALTLAQTVDVFNDGLRVAEITSGGNRMDLTLRGPTGLVEATQGIDSLPVVTRTGAILPVSVLGRVEVTAGPTEIYHLERRRTVSLEIRPSAQIPLEAAMEMLETQVIQPMQADGLPDGVRLSLSGTADKLTQTWDAMVWQLLLAAVIVYLVMAVLFESFIYPLIIMLTVPLASAGALLGLGVLNLFVFQPMDMLTLLGFVILIGIVVNNAILVVHQALMLMREERMLPAEAIREATRNRIRPIFMSTLTSLFGMLPLVIFPGAGSELYRGLGTVVLGGLALSAILTLVIMPPLLSLVVGTIEHGRLRRAEQRTAAVAAPPAPAE